MEIRKKTSASDDTTMLSKDDDSIELDSAISNVKPYDNDMRDRMIKYSTEMKFVKDRYITPVTVEFNLPLKSSDNTINIAPMHCNIFIVMRILDFSVKFITQDDKVFEHANDFSTENECKMNFLNTTEDFERFKTKNIFSYLSINAK